MTIVEEFEAGYQTTLDKPKGWDAPHPANHEHPRYFYAGMNSALERDGLELSMFLRAIPKVKTRVA